MQPLSLADEIELDSAPQLRVFGFRDDTLVRDALKALASELDVIPRWRVRIDKKIPVGAGLAGGSSDAATALVLANELVPQPLPPDRLHRLAASLGSDVPFFLEPGPKLAEVDGTVLRPLELPTDYSVLLLLPAGAVKTSTRAVYEAFDRRGGEAGFEERRVALLEAVAQIQTREDLARLPPNDLSSSPFAGEFERLGAFRTDVTGAGPVVYGLFDDRRQAEEAGQRLGALGRVWIVEPAW
jgi:4-diphosphocytidyl-2-C-methyl-D-erythritol kinase